MSGAEGRRVRLDSRLDDLVRNIVNGAGLKERGRAKLLPPRLSVRRVERGLNLFQIVSRRRQPTTILVGGEYYDYVHHFTAAAATYFLAATSGGRKPSDQWPAARDALVTTLHWASSPTRSALPFPAFPCTERQRHAAHLIGDYTFRFAVAHELAHVALDHEGVGVATSPLATREGEGVLRQSQEAELEADAVGLELQLTSLADPAHLVSALSSGVYFVYGQHLLVGRLMLLGRLVDHDRWKIRLTHPSLLHRVVNLERTARNLAGDNAIEGLERVRGDLWSFISTIWDAAEKRKASVSAQVTKSLRKGNQAASTVREILRLFETCPIGVIDGLVLAGGAGSRASVEEVLLELPEEFGAFVRMSRAARVDAILGLAG
jgi:hypothetical protein